MDPKESSSIRLSEEEVKARIATNMEHSRRKIEELSRVLSMSPIPPGLIIVCDDEGGENMAEIMEQLKTENPGVIVCNPKNVTRREIIELLE